MSLACNDQHSCPPNELDLTIETMTKTFVWKWSFLIGAIILSCPTVKAQSGLPLQPIDLESFSSFDSPGENWKLADSVFSDPNVPHSLEVIDGTGILVNQPNDLAQSNLYTSWGHGDLELELEFMIPQGSNSGIYLQGRYEVQLIDSWKRDQVTFGNVGGIYQRWNAADDSGFEGRRPRINAGRAPGLWQSLRIVFDAPRFDESGQKIQHARFSKVLLNGTVVQKNVTVTGPTRATGFTDEAPEGPLMIQGDHGPIALRNIRFRKTGSDNVILQDLTYGEYTGSQLDLADLEESATLISAGSIEHLQDYVVTTSDSVALRYEGQIYIPTDGVYRFQTTLGWISGDPHWTDRRIGGAFITVGNQQAHSHEINQPTVHTDVQLSQGVHPFRFGYYKTVGWGPPAVTLSVEGPSTRPIFLLKPYQAPQPAERILISPDSDPLLLRGFIEHRGTKRTHAIAVGHPESIHYSIDLSAAALLHVWRGPFVDAASMWHNRGIQQTLLPLGSTVTFSGYSALHSADDEMLQLIRYAPAPYPVFTYSFGEAILEDHLQLLPDSSGLLRTLILSDETDQKVFVIIAVSDHIAPISDTRFAIDGFSWYAETESKATIQQIDDGQALMISFSSDQSNSRAQYSIIW